MKLKHYLPIINASGYTPDVPTAFKNANTANIM